MLAAERSTSVGAPVADQIERLVGDAEAYRAARRDAPPAMEQGFHLGGPPYPKRDARAELPNAG